MGKHNKKCFRHATYHICVANLACPCDCKCDSMLLPSRPACEDNVQIKLYSGDGLDKIQNWAFVSKVYKNDTKLDVSIAEKERVLHSVSISWFPSR